MTALNPRDDHFLRHAIALSRQVRAQGKHPFAALVVHADGHIIAEAGNNSLPPEGDPTRHAELVAAALAARHLPPEVLAGATLYSSAEPCAMCAGAIYWCGIGRVVYARPELFRALIVVEGYNGQLPLPTAQNWFDYCPLNPATAIVDTLSTKKLPLLSLNGQNGRSINTGRSKQVCATLVDKVGKAGGIATGIYLPDIGITGNSHMMFWDRNSDQIAKVVSDWVRTNVATRR